MSIASRLGRLARSVVRDVTREGRRRLETGLRRSEGPGDPGGSGGSGGSDRSGGRRSRAGTGSRTGAAPSPVDVGRAEQRRLDVVTRYDVERLGLPELTYAPSRDDRADPGEVVWAWVPYDEDDGQGKDRPVLVLARLQDGVVGAQMTSKDRAEGGMFTDRHGRSWIDVGSGPWDTRGRDSEVRLDRLLHLPDEAVRREGAALDRRRYERVTEVLLARY